MAWTSSSRGALWAFLPALLLLRSARAAAPDGSCEPPAIELRKALACRYQIDEALSAKSLVDFRAKLLDPRRSQAACSYTCAQASFAAVRASCGEVGLAAAGAPAPSCPRVQVPAKKGWQHFTASEFDLKDLEATCRRLAWRECQDHYLEGAHPTRVKSAFEGTCCALPTVGPPPEPELPGFSSHYSDEDGEIRGSLTPGVYHVRIEDYSRQPASVRNFQQGWDFFLLHKEHPPILSFSISKTRGKPIARDQARRKLGELRFLGAPLEVFAPARSLDTSLWGTYASPRPGSDGPRSFYELRADPGRRHGPANAEGTITLEKLLVYFQEALDGLVIVPGLAREPTDEERARMEALAAAWKGPLCAGPVNDPSPTSTTEKAFDFNSGEITGLLTDGVFTLRLLDGTLGPGRARGTIHGRTPMDMAVGLIRPLSPLTIMKCSAPSLEEAPLALDPAAWVPLMEVRIMGIRVPVYRLVSSRGVMRLAFYDRQAATQRPFIYYHIMSISGRIGSYATQVWALQEFLDAARFRLLPRTEEAPPFQPKRQTEFFGIPLSRPGEEGPKEQAPAALERETPRLLR